MFTGIVEELGEVVAVDDLGDAARLAVRGPRVTGDVAPRPFNSVLWCSSSSSSLCAIVSGSARSHTRMARRATLSS